MNRRGFLSGLAAIAAGATLDPERLLWVPGAKLISIPRPKWLSIPAGYMPIPARYYPLYVPPGEPRIGDTRLFTATPYVTIKDGELVFWRDAIKGTLLANGWSYRPDNPLGIEVFISQ